MKPYFSKQFQSLLQGLCEKNVNKRLTLDQAKDHPFFQKVDWKDLLDKVAKAPLKTKVKHESDIHNIDKNIIQMDLMSAGDPNASMPEQSVDALKNMFQNFSYNKDQNQIILGGSRR